MPFVNSVRATFGPSGRMKTSRRFIQATGGTVSTSGIYKYHLFTGTGNLIISDVGNSDGSNTMEVLIVAGGGASSIQHAGGAGAGGLIYNPNYTVSTGTFTASVGGGGVVTSNLNSDDSYRILGASGTNSSLFGMTALGGGGASPWASSDVKPGGNGGSGGAGYNNPGNFGSGLQPSQSGLSGQYGFGNRSGAGQYGSSGGGAGGVGSDSQNSQGGDGKLISAFSQFGVSGYFAGGGGGGYGTGGPGGTGGGGGNVTPGQSYPPSTGNGVANTGGGGGGCGDNTTGGSGGSGVVIVRYIYQ